MNKDKITVRVAATSANIGGGFDCMGMALDLYHTLTVEPSDKLVIDCDNKADNTADNLIFRSMNAVFEKVGKKDMPVKLTSRSEIPQASGLGSSAACIVGGAVAANALLGNPLDESGIIDLCAALDGHPDNVVPALKGGVTAGFIAENGKVEFIKCVSPDELTLAVATPDFALHTEKARAALPNSYSRADCVYSLSRAVVTFAALVSGNTKMLRAVGDKLHQPYRIPLIKGYDDVAASFTAAGAISHCISGAGPSVVAFFDKLPKVELPKGWTLRILHIDNNPVFIR